MSKLLCNVLKIFFRMKTFLRISMTSERLSNIALLSTETVRAEKMYLDNFVDEFDSRHQWRAEVWWCPGRLLGCMTPYQILLSSCVWCTLLLDICYLWRYNMTSYPLLQTNVWRSLLTQHAYYSTRTFLLVVVQCVTIMNTIISPPRKETGTKHNNTQR